MKKRLIALLVATLVVLGVAIPIGAEESTTTYKLSPNATVIYVLDNANNIINALDVSGNNVQINLTARLVRYIDTTGDDTVVTKVADLQFIEWAGADRTFELANTNVGFYVTVSDEVITNMTSANRQVFEQVFEPVPEISSSVANTIQFWEEFWDKIFIYIAHPSYALYDINSPAFTVLALVFAGAFLLLVLDFIKQFFNNFRR